MGQRKSLNNFPWVINMWMSRLEFIFSAFRSCSMLRAAVVRHPDSHTVKWNERTSEENSRREVCAFEFPLTNFRIQALNSVNEEGDSVCVQVHMSRPEDTWGVVPQALSTLSSLFLSLNSPTGYSVAPVLGVQACTNTPGLFLHGFWGIGLRYRACHKLFTDWAVPQTEIFFDLLETEFFYIALAILKLNM